MTEAAAGQGIDLSTWETEFVEGVQARLTIWGSAFRDGAKGALDDPLSTLQDQKLRELLKKTKTHRERTAASEVTGEPDAMAGPEPSQPASRAHKKGLSRQAFGRKKRAGHRTKGMRPEAGSAGEAEDESSDT